MKVAFNQYYNGVNYNSKANYQPVFKGDNESEQKSKKKVKKNYNTLS